MDFTKNDYFILSCLLKNRCTNKLQAMTIKRLSKESKLSTLKVRQTLKNFVECEYTNEGCKQINAKTYYITKTGIEALKEITGGSLNE